MKNTLVQYKGGGYDGCFWEWNFCYFDKDGVWHDIFSSGRRGCDSLVKIQQHIKRNIHREFPSWLSVNKPDWEP